MSVNCNGKPIGGNKNPFPFVVIPAEASPKNTIAHGPGVEEAKVGKPNPFTVEARDKFDNKLTMGGAHVSGQLTSPGVSPVPVHVEDNGDGTYKCSYPGVTKAGNYELTPTLNGHPVKGAPFKIKVKPGGTSIDNTKVDFPPQNLAGKPGPVVSLYDNQKNKRHKGGDKIVAELRPKSRLKSIPARDNGDGSYDIDYPPHLRGKYEIEVKVNKNVAPGGPWDVDVDENPLEDEEMEQVQNLMPGVAPTMQRLLMSATEKERRKILKEIAALKNL